MSSTHQTSLLVELFVEELPPKVLNKLGQAFTNAVADSLKTQGFVGQDAAATAYASPRRLGVHITQVLGQSPAKNLHIKLMPKKVGRTEGGENTEALNKRLAKEGVSAADAVIVEIEEKGTVHLVLQKTESPVALAIGLQIAVNEAIGKLPIPKVMSYQLADGWTSVNFVRPAHGLVALHGQAVLPISLLGLAASNSTQGHRFEAKHSPIVIRNADSYAEQLESEGAVIPSFEKRRDEIARQLKAAAAQASSDAHVLTPIEDAALLDEVTALVERPNVLLGQFEEAFLEVPQECLISTMKANQKYFPLVNASGKLTNKFLIVSNITPADPSAVIGGNERVVRPRLADAKFFLDQDRKKKLIDRLPQLDKVVYHNSLGSQGNRVQRVIHVAKAIADALLNNLPLAKNSVQAAQLAKCDLITDMVGEFPELQGIMGRYYALNDGYTHDVANAIEDHYKPRFAGDELPRDTSGLVLALADKLETLIGLFGIGQIPTGDKDPFALRRHALGIIRMLIERGTELDIVENEVRYSRFEYKLPADLQTLIGKSFESWCEAAERQKLPAAQSVKTGTLAVQGTHDNKLLAFFADRLFVYLRDLGYTALEVNAVLKLNPQQLSDIPKRLAAVRSFSELPESVTLAAANKRISNILKKAEGAHTVAVDTKLFSEPAEIALNNAISTITPIAVAAFSAGKYQDALSCLAHLKPQVDAFFESVMVMADDAAIRNNRIALLGSLHQLMNQVADLSELAT